MGSGKSKIPTSKTLDVYTHQRKVDGSQATAAEEERRKRLEEQMFERAKEIEEHNRQMAKHDFAINFFMDIEEQKAKRETKKVASSKDKKPVRKKIERVKKEVKPRESSKRKTLQNKDASKDKAKISRDKKKSSR